MKIFVAPDYHDLLTRHGLNTFAGFWDLPFNWVEDPNERRKGWSGASFHTLNDDKENPFSMFVKRQENHNFRSIFHPMRGLPTFFREFLNIRRIEQLGIPTVTPVFYGHRLRDNNFQAVLALIALDGYSELNPVFSDPSLPESIRHAILRRAADLIWSMHSHHLQHRSLSGKHIMIKIEKDGAFDLRIIDLEQTRHILRPVNTPARDLEKFIRHTPTLTSEEHAEFIRHYVQHLKPGMRDKFTGIINRRIVEKWPTSKLSVRIKDSE